MAVTELFLPGQKRRFHEFKPIAAATLLIHLLESA